jgi:hypothetical protein
MMDPVEAEKWKHPKKHLTCVSGKRWGLPLNFLNYSPFIFTRKELFDRFSRAPAGPELFLTLDKLDELITIINVC